MAVKPLVERKDFDSRDFFTDVEFYVNGNLIPFDGCSSYYDVANVLSGVCRKVKGFEDWIREYLGSLDFSDGEVDSWDTSELCDVFTREMALEFDDSYDDGFYLDGSGIVYDDHGVRVEAFEKEGVDEAMVKRIKGKTVKEAKVAVNGRPRGLSPQYDSRKSFYNKANVVDDNDGNMTLYSYNTPVCRIQDGKVQLLPKWDYSQTTLRHVKEFLLQNGFEAGSKAQIAKRYSTVEESKSRRKRTSVSEKKKSSSSKLRIKEKLLKEGPGAGYEIKTSGLSDVVINSVKLSSVDTNKYGLVGVHIDVDATATIDEMYAESYYYGTGKMRNIPVHIDEVWADYDVINDVFYDDDIDVDELEESDFDEAILMRCASDALSYGNTDTSLMYGGGYLHSTYDGEVGDDDDVWHGYITDKDTIDYVDRAVSGENYSEEYRVIIDDYDIYDYYEDEEQAISVADELAMDPGYADCEISVEFVREYWDHEGMPFDYVEPEIEHVYSIHNNLNIEDQ